MKGKIGPKESFIFLFEGVREDHNAIGKVDRSNEVGKVGKQRESCIIGREIP